MDMALPALRVEEFELPYPNAHFTAKTLMRGRPQSRVLDREVADLARQHYADYANVIMRLSRVVPASVVRYLQAEGLPAREDALSEVNRTVEDAWRGEVRTAQPIGSTTPFSPSA
jgi:Lon protease-like protein